MRLKQSPMRLTDNRNNDNNNSENWQCIGILDQFQSKN